jgi:hypothetical protein
MRKIGWAAQVLALLARASSAACEPLRETTGLKTPESALPNPTGSFAYVSNTDGNPTEKDGNGCISKVSLDDGKILDIKWAKGLDAPKGMALVKDRLFVSEIDRLVDGSRDGKDRRALRRRGRQVFERRGR